MAAGFSLIEANIEAFRQVMHGHALATLKPEDYLPKFRIDAVASGAEAGPEALGQLMNLEPYGPGNPEPLFATYGARLVDVSPTSNPDHVSLTIEAADGTVRPGMAFGIGRALSDFDSRDKLDFAFSLDENHFNGRTYFRWLVRDYRPSVSA